MTSSGKSEQTIDVLINSKVASLELKTTLRRGRRLPLISPVVGALSVVGVTLASRLVPCNIRVAPSCADVARLGWLRVC